MSDWDVRYTDHGRSYSATGEWPCLACGGPVWFGRVWSGLAYYTQALDDDDAQGWVAIEQCPHCGESLSEFALLTHGFPETAR
jgi:hypothetical protein